MSGRRALSTSSSTRTKKRRTKAVVAAAAAAVAAGLVAAVALQPDYVTATDYRLRDDQAQQVPVTDPIAAAPAGTNTSFGITDVSLELAGQFAGDLGAARSTATGKEAPQIVALQDDCLAAWATENLGALAAAGAYQVVDVCDRPTVVLAGAAGADTKVLVHAAAEIDGGDAIAQILHRSTSNRMAFTAVRSHDGQAQLLAAAELPSVEDVVYDGTTDEEPPIINVRPDDYAYPAE